MNSYCSWCHQTEDCLQIPGKPLMHNSAKYPSCPQCSREIKLITIRRACEVVSKSKKTIHEWVNKGLVSTVRSASGTPLICLSSLFVPSDTTAISIRRGSEPLSERKSLKE